MTPDWSPYGYGYAEGAGYAVAYSETCNESLLVRAADAVAQLVLGFKVVHAARNWKSCVDSSVSAIWTHTEREHLPLLFLARLLRRPLPPVIAQSVWLIDEWERMPAMHRLIARTLMRRASICTFLSSVNARRAQELGLGNRREVVAFGVSLDSFPLTEPAPRTVNDAIRVFALGNDRHRDWETFAAAFCGDARFEIFAATSNFPAPARGANWEARQCTHPEIIERYRWADVVIVPLTANLHASGITSVLEATLLGKPVVVSDAGGIDWYFGRDELAFCPVDDAAALRSAAEATAMRPEDTKKRVRAAQATMTRKDLTSRGFALRHVAMTEELLGAPRALATAAE